MTEPNPSPEVCGYDQPDTKAELRSNDDGSWFSRCNCLTVTCESGTYEEALDALNAHRTEVGAPSA